LRQDRALIEERLRRQAGDIESLSMRMDDLADALERMQANTAHAGDNRLHAMDELVVSLQSRVTDLEAARVRDREEMINKLTSKIAEIVNKPTVRPPPATGSRPSTSQYGYEHTVQSGETLSAIAKAYGVGMSAIIQANNLQDPNNLKVGQTLFIPD
jgi:LysM repeat protein